MRKCKHGQHLTPTYRIWAGIVQRCRNPKNKSWKNYGGRGIVVCDRWFSFESFLADMGERPDGLTLDRIDNDGNYEPSNCRWTTQKRQIRNMRKTIMVEWQGETVAMADLADQHGIKRWVVGARLKRGLPIEGALNPPVIGWPKGKSRGTPL